MLARTLGHDLVPDGPNLADEDLEPWFRAALQTANEAGRRQATEAFAGAIDVLGYVSRGRRYVGVEPYPDATARRILGALDDAGMLVGPWEADEQAEAIVHKPGCACGYNDAGHRFIDLICRRP